MPAEEPFLALVTFLLTTMTTQI